MSALRWLDHPRPWRWAFLLGLVAVVPALSLGLLADDHLLRANFLRDPRLPELETAPWDAFHFYPPRAQDAAGIDQGFAVWWSEPGGRVRMLRPLASLSHWVDFRLWPDRPWLMHLQSALWYAALCGVVAALYRRLLAGWAAGLASLFFVVDYTHGMAAGWIANRNALMASTLGFLALWLHMRARTEHHRASAAFAPLALAAGLACGEVALGAAAFLAAHVACLETGGLGRRLRSLGPYLVVGAGWAAVYLLGGFGVRGSGLYTAPGSLAFFRELPSRLMLLLGSELGGPGPDFWPFLGLLPRAGLLAFVGAVLVLAAVALAPLVRGDATARFLALGAVLSALPLCSTFPSSRLALVPGFGLIGLVALACAAWRAFSPASRALKAFVVLAGGAHLVLCPPLLVFMERRSGATNEASVALVRGLPDEPALSKQRVVVVNLPDLLFTIYLRATLATASEQRAVPLGTFLLGLGTHELELTRVDERTLTVRDPAGFFGHDVSMLFRPEGSPMPEGTRVATPNVTVDVQAARDGVPTQVAFRFAVPLEDPSLRWVAWDGETLVPFPLPAIGARAVVAAHTHPLLRLPSGER